MANIEDLRQPLLPPVQIEPSGGISIPPYNGIFHVSGTTPLSISPIFGMSEDSVFDHPGGTEVLFLNLNEQAIFDKIQCRRGGQTKMRIENGVVKMVCKSPVQIMCIKVFVFRTPSAANLENDENGPMELPVIMGSMEVNDDSRFYQQFFSVDLDSIYEGPKRPAYKLARVEGELRNLFQLSVEVQYIGGVGYQEFTSIPFQIRTKPKPMKPEGNTKPKSAKRVRLESGSEDHENSSEYYRQHQDSNGNSSEYYRQHQDSNELFNGFVDTPESAYDTEYQRIECQNLHVVDHLEAQRASIDHLTCKVMESPGNADIGYRFKLKDHPHLKEYDEGDIVGFFKDEKGGTVIDLFDNSNASDAFLAGVISRSAYIEVKQSFDKETSDVVCVIGVVKVKCIGSVRAGERLYSAMDTSMAGTAIAEAHLPPGAVLNKRGTLLGMALEEKSPKKNGEVLLVKSFVCIVMGVNDKKLTMEIENMYDRFEMLVSERLKKERQRSRRVLCVTISVLAVLLFGLSVLAFELFYPGSALRVLICKEGSMRGHTSTFKFTAMDQITTYRVNGIEFATWKELQRKLKPRIDSIPPLNMTIFNITKVHYYLNIDRCSYGAIKLNSALKIDPKKEVGGPLMYAIDGNCSTVYYNTDVYYRKGCYGGWCPYVSVPKFPNDFRCHPKSEFT